MIWTGQHWFRTELQDMDEEEFSPQLTVSIVLRRWPKAIPIFLRYRMSCVGCSMAKFETLTDAIEIYHLPRDRFLNDIKKAIQEQSPDEVEI